MVTSTGGKAFFAGGQMIRTGVWGVEESVVSQLVAVYDAATNQWTTSQLSQPTILGTATSVDGKAFFAGGNSDSQQYLNKIDIYNTSTNQWSTATLSQGRYRLASASVGSKALFAGGIIVSMPLYTNVVDIYNATTNQWTTKQLSANRYSLAATSVGGKAIFAGGEISSDAVDIYDSATDTWATARLSTARSDMAATSAGNKAFFAGGRNFSNNLSPIIDIYDAVTDQWSTATLSQGRSGVAAASLGDLAFFAGGTDATGNASNVIDIYNTATNQWSSSQLPTVKGSLVAVSVNNKILFLENGSGKVDIYTLDNALPVNIVSFTGTWVDNVGAKLNWQTSAETQNDHYEIQRSSDAKSFESIGRAQGQGTSDVLTKYQFIDTGMPDAVSYYRLKQVDFDGTVYFSSIISVNRFGPKTITATLTVWPTPTTEQLTMQVSEDQIINKVIISDMNSRRILTQNGPSNSTDVSSLQPGIYIVEVITEEGQHLHSRFVKQ